MSKKIHILAAALAIAGAAMILHSSVYAPLVKAIRTKCEECAAADEMRNIIKSAQEAYEDRAFAREKDASLIIDKLTEHCKSMSVNIISMTTKEALKNKDARYKILPIAMEMEATGQSFSDFIGSLRELKESVITVNNFDVAPKRADPSKVRATMVIYVYLSEGAYGT